MAERETGASSHSPLTHVVYHVLLSLAVGEKHGYGIIKDVADRTGGRLELEAGTLYAAVKRLRDEGLIEEATAPEPADSRRRYYGITADGGRVLRAESERLAELVELARSARVLPPAREGRA
jgi:DNA-binding PadR family transcriptional regulator